MKSAWVIASIIVLVGGGLGNYLRFSEVLPDRSVAFERIPLKGGAFQGEEQRFAQISYEVLQADTSTLRLYQNAEGSNIHLFVAYFSSQKYGSQIHSPKNCLPGGGWNIQDIRPFELSLPENQHKTVNRLIITQNNQKQLMFYWFETRGGSIRSEFHLKWDLMKNSLLFRPTDAAFVRLTIFVGPNDTVESATTAVSNFLASFYPSIMNSLPFSGGEAG